MVLVVELKFEVVAIVVALVVVCCDFVCVCLMGKQTFFVGQYRAEVV